MRLDPSSDHPHHGVLELLECAAARNGVVGCLTTRQVAAVLRRDPAWVRARAVPLGGVREDRGAWRFTPAGVARGLGDNLTPNAPIALPRRRRRRRPLTREIAPVQIALRPRPRPSTTDEGR